MKKLLAFIAILTVLPVSAEAGLLYLVFRDGSGWAFDAERTPYPGGSGTICTFKVTYPL